MTARECFLLQIKATQDLLLAHEEKWPTRPSESPASLHILRAVVVFLVAAVDAYIHKRIVEVVKRKLRYNKPISIHTIRIIIPELNSGDTTSELKLKKVAIIINTAVKDKEKIAILLEEKILVKTFQDSTQVNQAFLLMGTGNGWDKTTSHFYESERTARGRKPSLKIFLDNLVERRNTIVHQGDMQFGRRYDGTFRSISRPKLKKDFQTLYKLVLSIDFITEKI